MLKKYVWVNIEKQKMTSTQQTKLVHYHVPLKTNYVLGNAYIAFTHDSTDVFLPWLIQSIYENGANETIKTAEAREAHQEKFTKVLSYIKYSHNKHASKYLPGLLFHQLFDLPGWKSNWMKSYLPNHKGYNTLEYELVHDQRSRLIPLFKAFPTNLKQKITDPAYRQAWKDRKKEYFERYKYEQTPMYFYGDAMYQLLSQ